jgi:ribosome maturation factor RimP
MTHIDEIRRIAEPLIAAAGLTLFDLELVGAHGAGKRRTLRIFIDKEGGVGVDDCATVSRQVGMAIEAEELIIESYTLEVSSPGLTRSLKRPEHYVWGVGKLAVIKLRGSAPAARATGGKALGHIVAADDTAVTLALKEGGETLVIPYDDIARANLEIEF